MTHSVQVKAKAEMGNPTTLSALNLNPNLNLYLHLYLCLSGGH